MADTAILNYVFRNGCMKLPYLVLICIPSLPLSVITLSLHDQNDNHKMSDLQRPSCRYPRFVSAVTEG